VRIGSFNVENLFDRARALDPRNRKKVAPVLNAYAEINALFEHTTYTSEDKARMVELLRTLRLGGKDDGGTYAELRQNRGRLLKRSKGKIEIVADGRASWIGWVELKMAPVNQIATQNTARVMHDVGGDVLAVVEADNRPALIKFSDILFKRIKAEPYAHVMLIDGNDDRGIDVALLTKSDYPIVRIRSHVDDRDDLGVIFSRDCPEYTVETPGGTRIVILVNHLKSKGYGKPADSNARRERQAHRVAEIYNGLTAAGEKNVVVLGDFNDFPDSPPLAPLLQETDLRDISAHGNFDDGGRPKGRRDQVPKQRAAPPQRRWWQYSAGAAGLAAIAVVLALTVLHGGGNSGREESAGLPDTPDYHSLLVNPSNSPLLQRLDVRRERPQLLGRDDPAPVRHRDDGRAADDAAAADEVDDLRVGVELVPEVGAGQRRDRLVRRLRIRYPAEPVRPVAIDAAVTNVQRGTRDRLSLPLGNRYRHRRSHSRKPGAEIRDQVRDLARRDHLAPDRHVGLRRVRRLAEAVVDDPAQLSGR